MNAKKILLVLQLLLLVIVGTACNPRVRGSGDIVTETRSVSNFDSISLSGSGEVIITQEGSESLSIETDDNVMQHVKAVVEGETLELGFKEGINMILPSRLIFYVGVDDLTSLEISGSGNFEAQLLETNSLNTEISGSGNIQITDLTADEVRARISGSGVFDLAGDVAAQDVSISGSGNYIAGDVCSASVRVGVSGSGEAIVCAEDMLDVTISGSGTVSYYGQPSVNSSGSGSGNLVSLGEK